MKLTPEQCFKTALVWSRKKREPSPMVKREDPDEGRFKEHICYFFKGKGSVAGGGQQWKAVAEQPHLTRTPQSSEPAS